MRMVSLMLIAVIVLLVNNRSKYLAPSVFCRVYVACGSVLLCVVESCRNGSRSPSLVLSLQR